MMRAAMLMRILALIFSVIGVYELLQLVNVEVVRFLPVHSHGLEDGMIVASIALLFGSAASAIALMCAFVLFRRDQSKTSSQLLLAWCGLVPVGFVAVFIYAYVHRA